MLRELRKIAMRTSLFDIFWLGIKTQVGSWQLAVGSWQLAVGSWQEEEEVGSWQLAGRRRRSGRGEPGREQAGGVRLEAGGKQPGGNRG